ncbi:MAG: LysM peptidoglycan-binding domain-containing protein [Verrucomicrobiaceae bacterium]|nr:MAG: LysM peptidoglycan-binding domain-containing protein [Verrucomicrobiaceae bacterium]
MKYPQLWRNSGLCLCLLFAPTGMPQADGATHVVRRGETLFSIARLHHTSLTTLQKLNPKVTPHLILKGQSLTVPGGAFKESPKASGKTAKSNSKSKDLAKSSPVSARPFPSSYGGAKPEPKKPAPGKALSRSRDEDDNDIRKQRSVGAITSYKVKKGDTLVSIARRKGTSVKQLMAMNRLSDSHLSINQPLLVPASGSPDGNTVDISPPVPRPRSQQEPASGRSSKKKEPAPAPKKQEPAPPASGTYYHIVRRNESFSSIAAEHGVSWGQLARANRSVDPETIRVNQRLNVPGTQVASRAPVREPPRSTRENSSGGGRARSRSNSGDMAASAPARERGRQSATTQESERSPSSNRLSAARHSPESEPASPVRQPVTASEDPLAPLEPALDATVPAADSAPTPMTAYKVAEGDTIESIAREFSTTPSELRALNRMNSFDKPIANGYVFVPWAAPVVQE